MLRWVRRKFCCRPAPRLPRAQLYCLRGELRPALGHIDDMTAAGTTPRVRTFAPILTAACAAPDRTLAKELATQCERCVAATGLSPGMSEHLGILRLIAVSEMEFGVIIAGTVATHAAPSIDQVSGGRAAVAGGVRAVSAALRRVSESAPLLKEKHFRYLRGTFLPWAERAKGVTDGAIGVALRGPCYRGEWRLLEGTTDSAGAYSTTSARLHALELNDTSHSEASSRGARSLTPCS